MSTSIKLKKGRYVEKSKVNNETIYTTINENGNIIKSPGDIFVTELLTPNKFDVGIGGGGVLKQMNSIFICDSLGELQGVMPPPGVGFLTGIGLYTRPIYTVPQFDWELNEDLQLELDLKFFAQKENENDLSLGGSSLAKISTEMVPASSIIPGILIRQDQFFCGNKVFRKVYDENYFDYSDINNIINSLTNQPYSFGGITLDEAQGEAQQLYETLKTMYPSINFPDLDTIIAPQISFTRQIDRDYIFGSYDNVTSYGKILFNNQNEFEFIINNNKVLKIPSTLSAGGVLYLDDNNLISSNNDLIFNIDNISMSKHLKVEDAHINIKGGQIVQFNENIINIELDPRTLAAAKIEKNDQGIEISRTIPAIKITIPDIRNTQAAAFTFHLNAEVSAMIYAGGDNSTAMSPVFDKIQFGKSGESSRVHGRVRGYGHHTLEYYTQFEKNKAYLYITNINDYSIPALKCSLCFSTGTINKDLVNSIKIEVLSDLKDTTSLSKLAKRTYATVAEGGTGISSMVDNKIYFPKSLVLTASNHTLDASKMIINGSWDKDTTGKIINDKYSPTFTVCGKAFVNDSFYAVTSIQLLCSPYQKTEGNNTITNYIEGGSLRTHGSLTNTQTGGLTQLTLGNSIDGKSTDNLNNRYGKILIYNNRGSQFYIEVPATNDKILTSTLTLPTISGTALVANSSVGGATQPIFINSSKQIATCSKYAGGTAVTLNGTSKATLEAAFYAPTAMPTSDGNYILTGKKGGSPVWSKIQVTGATLTTDGTATTIASIGDINITAALPTGLGNKYALGTDQADPNSYKIKLIENNDTNNAQSISITPFTCSEDSTNCHAGLVPAPTPTDRDSFLRGDGTWATVETGHYTANLYFTDSSTGQGSVAATNPYLNLCENGAVNNSYQINGSEGIIVQSETNSLSIKHNNSIAEKTRASTTNPDVSLTTNAFNYYEYTYDAQGHITGEETHQATITFPTLNDLGGIGTINANGDGRVSLNAVTDGTSITLSASIPQITNSTLGVAKSVFYNKSASTLPSSTPGNFTVSINTRTSTSGRYYGIETDANGVMYVNVPWVNHTLSTLGGIGSIALGGDGVISASGNKNDTAYTANLSVATASESSSGVVSTTNQTFAGLKTFADGAKVETLYVDSSSYGPEEPTGTGTIGQIYFQIIS